MANSRSRFWPTLSAVIAVVIALLALPQDKRQWAPSFLSSAGIHYGIDLAGGTQLDFRISEREIEEQIEQTEQRIRELEQSGGPAEERDSAQAQLRALRTQRENLVEAIRTVLVRRMNALGVSEATITPSYVGDEKHLLVECPGIIDTQKCIDTVGKTIKLEFKEEAKERSESYETQIREKVQTAQERLQDEGVTLAKLGEDFSSDIAVSYQERNRYFRDQLPDGLEDVWYLTPENGVVKREATVAAQVPDSSGNPTEEEIPGIFLLKVLKARTQTGRTVANAPRAFDILAEGDPTVTHQTHEEVPLSGNVQGRIAQALRSMQGGQLRTVQMEDDSARILFLRQFQPGRREMAASHILIAYEGATQADPSVSRSKEEALALAMELRQRLDDGANFESLAQQYSDGASGQEGGSLGTFTAGSMMPAFEQAAMQLQQGEISDPVETQFGYHIIRSDQPPEATPAVASYEELRITGDNAATRASEMLTRLQSGEVRSTEEAIVVRSLFFSLKPTGWSDTLLDGKHFRSATVTRDPTTSVPVVQIMFDEKGAELFRKLTKENTGKRIAIFVGGELVSAPTVQQEIAGGTAVITGMQNYEQARLLARELNTGAIPAPIHLTGQRTVEASLGAQALDTSLQAAALGIVVLLLYMIAVYRLLGLLADIALAAYGLIFLALLKLPLFLVTDQQIVLTLAGMAGIILSIGMAVDANVLIFERMKEELRKGKMLKTACETGFKRAWPSIRDGNVSTFITCAILFTIGTSIVRGFAVTLGLGVLISMFSAIVITRWLIFRLAESPLAEKRQLLPAANRR